MTSDENLTFKDYDATRWPADPILCHCWFERRF